MPSEEDAKRFAKLAKAEHLSGMLPQVEAAVTQAGLNQLYVPAADRVGVDEGIELLGQSVIASPFAKAIAGPLSGDREAVMASWARRDQLRAARHRGGRINPREERRTDVYEQALGYDGPRGAAPTGSPNPETTQGDVLLREMEGKKGYLLAFHRFLAREDPTFLAAYETFLDAAYNQNRRLPRMEFPGFDGHSRLGDRSSHPD